MTFGNSFAAKLDMTLRTNKRRVLFLLIELKIQSTAVVCGGSDMTTFGAATGSHGDLTRLPIDGI